MTQRIIPIREYCTSFPILTLMKDGSQPLTISIPVMMIPPSISVASVTSSTQLFSKWVSTKIEPSLLRKSSTSKFGGINNRKIPKSQ
jgi:hypothetical protein